MRTRLILLCAAATAVSLALVVVVDPAGAVNTRSFEIDDADALDDGKLERTAVHSDGTVTAGVELRRLALPDIPVAWCFARAADGTVFVGTGNDGKIFRLRGDDVALHSETRQLLVSALAIGDGGTLYAGTLPEGRIYGIDAQGAPREIARPDGVEHVWALLYDARRRTLFAATGPQGKVFAIDAQGRAEVYWDSDAAHIMSLALDADGNLLAGTSDDALLVRLRGPGRAEVLHDFPGNEVTALAVRDGMIAAAANEFGGPPSSATPSKVAPPPLPGTTTPIKASASRPRTGKGRLWTISREGRAEQVLARDDGHFTSVQIADGDVVYAGAGADGRIHRVNTADRTSATWIDVDERQVLAIDLIGPNPLFVTADAGAIYRVLPDRPASAIWTSKVLDAEFAARWGELTWRADGNLELQTRSGNTEEPNETWSEWSASLTSPGPVRSPGARFLQIRARWTRDGNAVLRAVTAFYLPQNQRATVRDVALKAPRRPAPAKATDGSSSSDSEARPSTTYPLTWKVDNPDGDRLRYRLRFRSEGQTTWRDMLRESEIHTRTDYTWETNAVPDGWYVVDVEASDELDNPEPFVLRHRGQSEPFLVDNHAPVIEQLRAQGRRLQGRATDAAGPIAKLEYAVDGGEWRPFFPADDLLDTRQESFDLDLARIPAGDHIIAVRATDSANNVGSAEVQARLP